MSREILNFWCCEQEGNWRVFGTLFQNLCSAVPNAVIDIVEKEILLNIVDRYDTFWISSMDLSFFKDTFLNNYHNACL